MRPGRHCAVIAHRGGAREVPENTWSAVEHVVALGLDWMETDLRVTADDVVVLSHDPDPGRLSGEERPLSDMSSDEVAMLDAGDGHGFARLDEVLAVHPGLSLNVDLKEPAVVQPALQAVRAADALARVRFASFSDAVQVPPAYRGVPVVTRRFVAQAHAAGLEVHVWTIDDPEEMVRLAALNVDAVITDVPSLALEALGS